MTTNTAHEQHWSDLYRAKETKWDIGYASPPLVEYIDQLEDKNKKILIPGCGFAYEAEYLLEKGFTDITLIDFSSGLVELLKKKFGGKLVRVVQGDFFAHHEQYDLILEQTFFCALPPVRRKEWVDKMYELLKPGASLAGVFFNREFEEGPPFGGNRKEYQELFELKLFIKTMEPCYNSVEARKGAELFVILKNII